MIEKLTAPLLAKVAGAALVVAIATAGVQTLRLSDEQRDHEKTKKEHAEQVALLEKSAREAETKAREEESRRADAIQEIANETQSQLVQARADADAAAASGERLRQHIAAVTASCRRAATDSVVAAASAPAGPADGLLEVVQRRLDEAAERIARHADEARAAGLACQRSYDALKSQ